MWAPHPAGTNQLPPTSWPGPDRGRREAELGARSPIRAWYKAEPDVAAAAHEQIIAASAVRLRRLPRAPHGEHLERLIIRVVVD